MTPELRRQLDAIRHCLGPLVSMLADAETHATPGPTLDGLLKARARLTAIQGWLQIQGEK